MRMLSDYYSPLIDGNCDYINSLDMEYDEDSLKSYASMKPEYIEEGNTFRHIIIIT